MKEVEEYACLNWLHHLNEVLTQGGSRFIDLSSDNSLLTHLIAFKGRSFDCWIDTLIHLTQNKEAIRDMRKLVSKLQVSLCSSAAIICEKLSIYHNVSSWLQCLRILYSLLKVSQLVQRFDLYPNQLSQVLIGHHCNPLLDGVCTYIWCQFEIWTFHDEFQDVSDLVTQ
jgi:hypothetical protein